MKDKLKPSVVKLQSQKVELEPKVYKKVDAHGIAAIDPEKFRSTVSISVDQILRLEGILQDLEGIIFDKRFINSLSAKELLTMYQFVSQRKDSSQRYLSRIFDSASKTEFLHKLLNTMSLNKEKAEAPSLEEKEVVAKIRTMVTKKEQE